jgi:predicted SnoaL-like aldol condensation-catalyzing enzyme
MRLQSDEEIIVSETTQEKNKALVLDAFDTLFNKRDYAAAEKYWSPDYIQHSAHIEPGRDGLFNLIRNAPDTLRYEHQLIAADGDYVIVHGRFSGHRPVAWIAADIVRRAAAWPNTGTFCKTRQQKLNPRAASQCSARSFQRSEEDPK